MWQEKINRETEEVRLWGLTGHIGHDTVVNMSRVTNVMVAVGVDNWTSDYKYTGIIEMNSILEKEARGQILICIDDYVGGLKNFEISVWAAAFNYVSVGTIISAAINANWENPQQVQLMICDQEDYIFTVKTVEEWSKLIDENS